MRLIYRESFQLVLLFVIVLTGARSVRAGQIAPPLIVSVGESVRVTGVITVEPDPAPIGYPGPIMTQMQPQMFERTAPGGTLRPIRMILLLIMGSHRPAARARATYRVAVAGRYSRLLGADSIIVSSIVVESELPETPGPDWSRRERFRILHRRR